MNLDAKSFPPQKLSMRDKTEDWGKQSLDAIIARKSRAASDGRSRRERIRIEQDLFEGIFDEDDLRYVTDPFKVEDSFPATPQNMNIIRPKVNLLIGEESKRPYSYSVIQTNDESVSMVEDQIKQAIQQFMSDILQTGQQDLTDEQVQQLEEELQKIRAKYQNPAEKLAFHTLNYLKYKLNLSDVFLKAWKDYLINSEAIIYNGIRNGMPMAERVDPKYCEYDNDPDVDFIEDGDWFVRRMPMTASAIYDRFYDLMDESDLDRLLEMVQGGTSYKDSGTGSHVNTQSIVYRDRIPSDQFLGEEYGYGLLNVYHGVWRSYKKIGFLVYVDENGEIQEEVVDETYKPDANEEVTWDWVVEIWEGYRIGTDLYVGVQPVEYQSISIDNPNSQKLPYCGIPYKGRSLVNIMKPLQYMYIIIWYRLELALARDKGKVITMDITQIPKSMGVDTNRWLHMLSAMGVNFINPHEEGWDIPGREGGKPSAYNQFSSIDLTMSNVIVQYIELMNKIEEMIGELSGVTRQREGSITSSELVGNVQRAVQQSSHITEPLFWQINLLKKNFLNQLLDTAKYAWSTSDLKSLHYFLPDATRVFMEITDDFLFADFDVFVNDPTVEDRNIEMLKSLLQPAMQNGATLSDVAAILTSNNLSDIKNKLQEVEQKRQKIEAQARQEELAVQQEIAANERELKLEELRIKEEDSIRDYNAAIEVAQINIGAREADSIAKESLEREKLQAQVQSKEVDTRLKEKELQIKQQAANNKTKQ